MRIMRKHSTLHYSIHGYIVDSPDKITFKREKRIISTLGSAKREATKTCKSLLIKSDFTKGKFIIEVYKKFDDPYNVTSLSSRSLVLTNPDKKIWRAFINEESSKWFDTPEGRDHQSWEIIHDTRCFEWSD